MADVVPPVPPSAGTPAAANALPAGSTTLTVPNPPPGLSQIAIGTAIQGTVSALDGQGNAQIQTPVGTLTVPTNLPLPQNAILTLLLQTLTPQARLQLTSINGQLPALALQTQPTGSSATGATPNATPGITTGTTPSAATIPAAVPSAPTLTATLLQPAFTPNPGAQPGQGTQSPSPASTPTQTPVQTQTPATAFGTLGTLAKAAAAKIGIPTTATSSATPTPGGPTSTTAGATAAASSPGATLPAGTEISVRLTNIQTPVPGATPPSLSTSTPVPLAAGQTLAGLVTGATPAGQTIVQTPAGQLSLPLPEPLPTGTTLNLETVGRPVPPPVPPGVFQPGSFEGLPLTREWPALKEAMQVLQQANPAVAQQVMTTIIPRLDVQLTANVLFFLLMLRGGDIRGWLGEDATKTLDDTRPGLLTQLRSEFAQLSRVAEDPVAGDWRLALIPINTGEALEQIMFFMRQRKKEKDGKGETETRFVIDVGLTNLGRIQLDGLVGERNKRLDLIVRSQSHLPDFMQNDIRTIFINASEVTGMNGGLSFQAAPPKFVEIPASAPSDTTTGIMA